MPSLLFGSSINLPSYHMPSHTQEFGPQKETEKNEDLTYDKLVQNSNKNLKMITYTELSKDTLSKLSNTIHSVYKSRKCTKMYLDILIRILKDRYKA